MKKILLTTLTVFTLSTQTDLLALEHTHNWNSSPSGFISAVKVAKAEQKLAKKLGFEWRDIDELLQVADKKYKAGDIKGAMKLVNEAKIQAILGQKQAYDQASAGPRF